MIATPDPAAMLSAIAGRNAPESTAQASDAASSVRSVSRCGALNKISQRAELTRIWHVGRADARKITYWPASRRFECCTLDARMN